MNNFFMIIIVFIALSFMAIALKLTLEIGRNVKVGEKFRKQLMGRLEQLPIINMLGKRDININEYLHSLPIIDVEKQMHNCEECSAKKECKDSLEKTAETNYSFCPNNDDFDNFNDK